MKTKGTGKHKIKIVTLGCPKNLVDSEVLLAQLRGNDVDVVHDPEDKDSNVVIINTCGFIENAKQESIDTILQYAHAKKEGQIDKVYVTGCLSQRYKEDLRKEIPTVDAWFGTRSLPALLKQFNVDYKHELIGERIATPHPYAYLKISEGCDRPCSFCAIPLMRGKHVSKAMEQIVQEAKHLVKQGIKEILLIAQDSTYYGLDIYGKRTLAALLDRLSDVEGIEWLRLHYAFPTGFPLDILDIMSKKTNICNYLDIPLQHASDKMLKQMRRGTTRTKTEKLLMQIRDYVPNIAIRTTFIVGFPGETEDDFGELIDFIQKNKFERLGVFTYSHEEDTHAYSLKDDVSEDMKKQRERVVMETQKNISLALNKKKVGSIQRVIIDRMEENCFIGRTEHDSPEIDNEVYINTSEYLSVGSFVNVKINKATAFDLYGIPI